MKYLTGLYIVMTIMVFVNLMSEFIFNGDYSAIASWFIVMLYLAGTILYAVAKAHLTRHHD
ncbi:hypothetical protein [Gracilibacillus massiliensis]|uniref:hypothetical protein n=1 Tax=Gracilibacillus massiliensis TaxID=1564956 RepID=UPI00071E28EA|nr:hypothetical protein [Gracilibacillus massiliensis]